MCRLVLIFIVRKQQLHVFSHWDPYDVEVKASWPRPDYVPVIFISGGKNVKQNFI